MNLTRRDWLLATACWAEILRAQPQKFRSFDPATAAEIEAIAEQILPGDDTPGAKAAGVIWFIDGALAGYDQDKRDLYKKGLAEAQAKRTELFPGSTSIAGLRPEQQIALLKAIEKGDFFIQVRTHTILGYFGNPKYGGRLIGQEPSMMFQPPFGYYDAEAAKKGTE